MLPAVVSFTIAFSLFGIVPNYVMHSEVITPLAEEMPIASPQVLAVSTTNPTPTPASEPNNEPLPTPLPSLTPTPKPSISPSPQPKASSKPPVTAAQMDEWFTNYANKESVNRDLLKKIAVCESKLNPKAVNGIYGGMFQFSSSTWISTRRFMNMDTDPKLRFDAEEAIKTAAVRIATMGDKAWPNCTK